MIRQILVAIDGSAASMHALDVACEFAEATNSTLVVMTVMDELPAYLDAPAADGSSIAEEAIKRLRGKREALLRHALGLVPESVPARRVVTTGDPAEKILQQLEGGEYDLAVIGTRGLKGMTAVLLGSVSRHVLQRAEVPVLVVRAEEGREAWTPPATTDD